MTETASDIENMHPATGLQPELKYRNDFNLQRELPSQLSALDRISQNFAWSWLQGGTELFREFDPYLWDKCEQNPRLFLKRVGELRLLQKAEERQYVDALNAFDARLITYLKQPPVEHDNVTITSPAAYFCAEFGVHNSLPIYSGGLGILAGDHLKSASDLNVPLVAVGLLYRFGYFRQKINHDGWQEEKYNDVFESELALSPVLDHNGERVLVSVHIRGRKVHARAWLAEIGRISLYLLDTHVPENEEIDRLITGHLYGGSTETRIVQEKMLGIGGVRLLRMLNMSPSVFHLNEGHSAFLTLELAHEYLALNPAASFEEAKEAVRNQCVFTTHTPVDAGNDAFDPLTLQACFSSEYLDFLKISRDEFFDLGRTNPENNSEFFGMTPFAINMSRSSNGVSEKHGEVSRNLWLKMFRDKESAEEVPITHVTNGVHAPTWIAPAFQKLFEERIGSEWQSKLQNSDEWNIAIENIPDQKIWETHLTLKRMLIAYVRKRIQVKEAGTHETIHEHLDTQKVFAADVLTIGFARRVAAYKRWNLLLSDLDRILKLVDDQERPVQFVFAGKAHPQDKTAKQILQHLMSINNASKWQDRAVFIEDYDQEVARYLVHGVDVWMNVPRRPLEASGTSGMKAAMNGVLNFSVLDGWWIEGYNGENGFSIGELEVGTDEEMDTKDADSLYSTLENELVPAFYNKDENGLPTEWVRRMKNALATLTPQFSTDRMVKDYLEKIYKP